MNARPVVCLFFFLSERLPIWQRTCEVEKSAAWGAAEEHSPEEDAQENDTKYLQIKMNWQRAGLQYKSPCFCANHWRSSSFFFKVSYFSCQLCMLNTRAHVYTHRGIHCSPWISFGESALNLDFSPHKNLPSHINYNRHFKKGWQICFWMEVIHTHQKYQ